MGLGKGAKNGTGQITARADSLASVEPQRSAAKTVRPASPKGLTTARAILKTNRDDGAILDCQIIDQSGTEIGAVVVARLPDLQVPARVAGSPIGGVTFVKVDKNTMTASDGSPDETWEVTLDYVEDFSVLILLRMPGGTGLVDDLNGDRRIVWQDMTPRSWAVE